MREEKFMETVTLNNGLIMPVVGYGTYQIESDQTQAAVTAAIRAGYRLIDTAQYYGNEAGVGQALRQSGLPRTDFFVTSKTPLSGYAETKAGIDESLQASGLDYFDLMLIHWPIPNYLESYGALEDAVKEGKIKAIGLSNFNHQQVDKVLANARVKPVIDQVETHLLWQQAKLHEYLVANDLVHQAWSPLGQGAETIMDNPVLDELAAHYQKSPAQVALRFLLQEGVTVIPKALHPQYLAENIALFDFELTVAERAALRAQDQRQSLENWPSGMQIETQY